VTLGEAIFTHLSNVAGVRDLLRVDATTPVRIYPMRLPQSPTYPAITYQNVSDTEEYSHGGRSGLQVARVQFSIWGKDASGSSGYDSVYAVLRQLKLALVGHDGAMGNHIAKSTPLGGRDLPESEPGIYHHAIDFQIALTD
jgi:hypothetical protein